MLSRSIKHNKYHATIVLLSLLLCLMFPKFGSQQKFVYIGSWSYEGYLSNGAKNTTTFILNEKGTCHVNSTFNNYGRVNCSCKIKGQNAHLTLSIPSIKTAASQVRRALGEGNISGVEEFLLTPVKEGKTMRVEVLSSNYKNRANRVLRFKPKQFVRIFHKE